MASLQKTIRFLRESNAIEGVYDTDSFLQATYAWEYVIEQDEMTPAVILRTHKILMLNQELFPDEKGYFRKCAVYIGGRRGEHHKKVKGLIKLWCTLMNEKPMKKPGTEKGFENASRILHVAYERIHPFVDGNGRTGRIFMNWWRIKNGLPILVIKESERQKYYKWFK